MLLTPIKGLPNSSKIEFICDSCTTTSIRSVGSIKNSWYKSGIKQELCIHCSRKIGASKRPQNSQAFIRLVGSSTAYYEGIKNRPSIVGSNNPMYGKAHSLVTRQRMSRSRTGKIGSLATAWKGGKLSFNSRIKSAVQRKWKWFTRVIQRDKHCTQCGDTKQLDAHHITPISALIKHITYEKIFESDNNKFNYVIEHDLIKDTYLTNGITLCRACHKQIHQNWGSHEPKISK